MEIPSMKKLLFMQLAVLWLGGALAQLPSGKSCFCKLSGSVDECECSVGSVDDFNNQKVFPLLQNLLQRDFFRYYKVNMDATCPFWQDERSCSSEKCGVESCDSEVPEPLKNPPNNSAKVQKKTEGDCESETDAGNTFDPLDKTVSGEAEEQFASWKLFDDSENKFCIADDEEKEAHYVDLLRNPERYTGYKGNSAAKVWKCIYMENCFKPNPKFDKNFLLHPTITGSDLRAPGFPGQGRWVRNVDMFKGRFSPETTWGEGPQRLKNLYFVYLMELRALHKVAPYLKQELFYTGNSEEDELTRKAVEELMSTIKDFPDHFDESSMFQGVEARARELKEEFRQHFLNISRIMDCVDCDKCRLWGKLQTHGIGTALKILFSKIPAQQAVPSQNCYTSSNPEHPSLLPFQLNRNEVVALFNSFGRFAANIREIAEFRRAMT